MSEEWRPVPGYPKYEASSWGRVRGPRGVLKGYAAGGPRNGWRYLGVTISNDTGRLKTYVHRVVCLTFHGPPPKGSGEVDHIDRDRFNNRPGNLRWVSRGHNMQWRTQRSASLDGPAPWETPMPEGVAGEDHPEAPQGETV